jgi:prepilin-type N-terminal cleavage/methylation domain-containing protein
MKRAFTLIELMVVIAIIAIIAAIAIPNIVASREKSIASQRGVVVHKYYDNKAINDKWIVIIRLPEGKTKELAVEYDVYAASDVGAKWPVVPSKRAEVE